MLFCIMCLPKCKVLLLDMGKGDYFFLPKLVSHIELYSIILNINKKLKRIKLRVLNSKGIKLSSLRKSK